MGIKNQVLGLFDRRRGAISTVCQLSKPTFAYDFSYSREFVFAGCDDGTVSIINIETGKVFTIPDAHDEKVRSVALSTRGRYGISCSDDNQMILWDLKLGNLVFRFSGETKFIQKVIFSPDGRKAVTGNINGAIQGWDIKTGKEVFRIGYPTFPIEQVAVLELSYLSNSPLLAVAGDFFGIPIWDADTGQISHVFENIHNSLIRDLVFSKDNRFMISCSRDQNIGVWDVKSGRIIHLLQGHSLDVMSVDISPDNKYIVSGSWDQTVRIWDLEQGRQIKAIQKNLEDVMAVSFTQDGRSVLYGMYDGRIQKWDYLPDKVPINNLPLQKQAYQKDNNNDDKKLPDISHKGAVIQAWFSKDGDRYLTADAAMLVQERDASTGDLTGSYQLVLAPGMALPIVSLDADFVLSSGRGDVNLVHLYDLKKQTKLLTFNAHRDTVLGYAFSPVDPLALSYDILDNCYLWEIPSGGIVQRLQNVHGPFNHVIFSSDGQYIVGGGLGPVQVWRVADGKKVAEFTCDSDQMTRVDISFRNHFIIAANDSDVYVWDLIPKQLIYRHQHSEKIQVAKFATSKDHLLIGSDSGIVHLIDWRIGNEILSKQVHKVAITDLDLSKDGYGISGDESGRCWSWKINNL